MHGGSEQERGGERGELLALRQKLLDLWQIESPMDLATLLMRVEERRYSTADAWLADLQLIVHATEQVPELPPL